MFWDKVSGLYDFVETVYNGKVYRSLGKTVAAQIEQEDVVLECACGTGAISRYIAPKCRQFIVTDFSKGMLRQAAKKCRNFENITIKRANMTQLKCQDSRFDKVQKVGNLGRRESLQREYDRELQKQDWLLHDCDAVRKVKTISLDQLKKFHLCGLD